MTKSKPTGLIDNDSYSQLKHEQIFMQRAILILSLLLASAAAAAPSIWQPVANDVCKQIDDALHLYQKNDIKAARSHAIMSYFRGYDAEIEPAVRITLGGPHVFAIEKKFRDFSAEMSPNPDKNRLKKIAATAFQLCQMVQEDARALDKEQVPRQVFKVE